VSPCAAALLTAALTPALSGSQATPNVVIQWNNALLQGVRDSKIGPPMVARALAIAHTCMYDSWAAYDSRAVGTMLGGTLRRPAKESTDANKDKAISYGAYRAAVDLFASDQATVFDPLMTSLGYDPTDNSTNTTTPQGIGNVACAAVLNFRHEDGSNQLGDHAGSNGKPYSDYTGFVAANPSSTVPVIPATVTDPNHWQPLQYVDVTNTFITQGFLGAQWYLVIPFAMTSGQQYESYLSATPPYQHGDPNYTSQSAALLQISAGLTDTQKMIGEYWKDGPHSETPPGHWCLHAQYLSTLYNHTRDQDVKMFFAMTNATFDASIAAWDAKHFWNSVRPLSSIPLLYNGMKEFMWGGPYKGRVFQDGSMWIPYQPSNFPTPPFPEFISGHSTFSRAAAEALKRFTGGDNFGFSVSFAPGSSVIEPGAVPANTVTLTFPTLRVAADQAGLSRRYGGIHFQTADLQGRAVGLMIGDQAFAKAQTYWQGTATGMLAK
jgi:hypothetical protein